MLGRVLLSVSVLPLKLSSPIRTKNRLITEHDWLYRASELIAVDLVEHDRRG